MFSTNIYNKHSANTQLLLFLVPQDWVTPWALGKSQHKWSVSFQTSRTAQCITGNDSINYFRALNCLPRTPPTEPSSTLAQSHLRNANLQCYGCYGCLRPKTSCIGFMRRPQEPQEPGLHFENGQWQKLPCSVRTCIIACTSRVSPTAMPSRFASTLARQSI